MTESRIRYSDVRPYVVADSLEELTGPTTGVVELPRRLDWSEQGTYDLDDIRELRVLYEVVLRESMNADDLRIFIDGATLRDVWRDLFLPRRVRAMWEKQFPPLAESA